MSGRSTVHRLKITLQDIKPPIWRRLEVPSDATLAQLHHYIQTVFGWFDAHLHEFEIEGTTYGVDDGEGWGDPPVDERKAALSQVAPAGARFTYRYDFGDNWEHRIDVEAVEEADREVSYPRCTAGRREAPPDDIGGAWGYPAFVEAVTDPNHPEHDEMVDWYGRDDFDPEYFNLDGINDALRAWAEHAPPDLA